MDNMKTDFRVILDTNVILASQNATASSPNREIIDRWIQDEFLVLYSTDILEEYYEKLVEKNIPQTKIDEFFSYIFILAQEVTIFFYHFPSYKYPEDPDDVRFVLCAYNGSATHIIGYDEHLLKIDKYSPFRICKPIPFLKELRRKLEE